MSLWQLHFLGGKHWESILFKQTGFSVDQYKIPWTDDLTDSAVKKVFLFLLYFRHCVIGVNMYIYVH